MFLQVSFSLQMGGLCPGGVSIWRWGCYLRGISVQIGDSVQKGGPVKGGCVFPRKVMGEGGCSRRVSAMDVHPRTPTVLSGMYFLL